MGNHGRRHLYLLLLALLVSAGAQLLVWIADAIHHQRTPPPVKAARAFVTALSDGYLRDDACERALSLLAASSRSVFQTEMQEVQARSARYGSQPRACIVSVPAARPFTGLRAKTARLISQESGRAVVRLERHEADPKSFRVPGFWPSRWIVTQTEMRLVDEAGQWKIALP